jgi:hypothetical protein
MPVNPDIVQTIDAEHRMWKNTKKYMLRISRSLGLSFRGKSCLIPLRSLYELSKFRVVWVMLVKGCPSPLRSLYELSKFRVVWVNVRNVCVKGRPFLVTLPRFGWMFSKVDFFRSVTLWVTKSRVVQVNVCQRLTWHRLMTLASRLRMFCVMFVMCVERLRHSRGHSMSYQSSVWMGLMFVIVSIIPVRSLYELSKFRTVCVHDCRVFDVGFCLQLFTDEISDPIHGKEPG